MTSRPIEAALITSRIASLSRERRRCDTTGGDCSRGRPLWSSLGETSVCNRFCQTLVDGCEQRVRRERLTQADLAPSSRVIAKKSGARRVETRKRVTGHRDQRNLRRALMKYPDRFEAAHMRHENIDQHHIECCRSKRRTPASPPSATVTSNPLRCRQTSMATQTMASSSTTRNAALINVPTGKRRNLAIQSNHGPGTIRAEMSRGVCTIECIVGRVLFRRSRLAIESATRLPPGVVTKKRRIACAVFQFIDHGCSRNPIPVTRKSSPAHHQGQGCR